MYREPLSHLIRPKSLDEFIGQNHLTSEESVLYNMIKKDKLRSMIFYGPPGTGKTTMAEIITVYTDSEFVKLDATSSGVKDVRNAITKAVTRYDIHNKRTVVFIDEVHRYNKSQQDALLSSVEAGIIILIGATTENPFFSINGPLISRSQIFEFKPHGRKDIIKVLKRGIDYYRSNGIEVSIEQDAARHIIIKSDGDARKAVNALELIVECFNHEDIVNIDVEICKKVMPTKSILFDKNGDVHFDLASAYQGSLQASDPDAAIYWLARWIKSGEDIMYIARRMFVSAAEDVGMANPSIMSVAYSAFEACRVIGLPECALHLAVATITIATSQRNKSAANAIWEALDDVENGETVWVPPEMRDSHYEQAMKLGRGSYHDGKNQSCYIGINKKYYKPHTHNLNETKFMEFHYPPEYDL